MSDIGYSRCDTFETTLELLFICENIKGIRGDKVYVYFMKRSVMNRIARPFMVVVIDVDGGKHRFMTEELYNYLGYVPLYKLTVQPTRDYNYIDINDSLVGIDSKNKSIGDLKRFAYDAQVFNTKMKFNDVPEEDFARVIKMLNDNEIPFETTPLGITLYTSSEHYRIEIPRTKTINDCQGYSISVNPYTYTYQQPVETLGMFSIIGGTDVKPPACEHLAIIDKCTVCGKSMVSDYGSYHTQCPYCSG